MVKLIRIVSEDNAVFNANLDAGIAIDENASIALQNLTFDNKFASLKINVSNRDVVFNLDVNSDQDGIPPQVGTAPPVSKQPTPRFDYGLGYLNTVNYDQTNYKDFYLDLQAKLNKNLSVALNVNSQDIYSSFLVDTETDPNRPIIRYKYSPLCLLFSDNKLVDREDTFSKELFNISLSPDNTTSLLIDLGGGIDQEARTTNSITQDPTNPATDLLQNYICGMNETAEWCKGSAFLGCYVYNAQNNAGADNTNGFGIGLSFTDICAKNWSVAGVIDDSWRDFEILIEKNDAPYRYISPATPNTEQISATLPEKVDIGVDPNEQVHDRIVFQRNAGVITGSVWQYTGVAGGTIKPIFSYVIPDADLNKPLHPYIWVKGEASDTTVGTPIFTPNSLDLTNLETNKFFEITGRQQNLGARGNWFEILDGGNWWDYITPRINNNRMVDEFLLQNITLELDANIWKFIGWDLPGTEGRHTIEDPFTNPNGEQSLGSAGICGFNLQGTLDVEFINSDNYVVVLESNSLDSFDASKFNYSNDNTITKEPNEMRGRRLNILATIPKNDNTGYLEFQAQVPTFIDLDNKFKQQLKNIRVKVLDKDLNPISTIGTSIITLLIQDK